jgi:hypothetical protein
VHLLDKVYYAAACRSPRRAYRLVEPSAIVEPVGACAGVSGRFDLARRLTALSAPPDEWPDQKRASQIYSMSSVFF